MPRAHWGAREKGGGGGGACKSKDGGEELHDDGVVLGGLEAEWLWCVLD
jgi:hypothetical protein